MPHSLTDSQIARTMSDLTADWFTRVLHTAGVVAADAVVSSADVEPVGTGQMSAVLRAELTYGATGVSGPGSVVVKLASTEEAVRQTGLALGFYSSELRFYREVASTVDIRVPECHIAEIDSDGWFTLLMSDSPSATPGNMVEEGTTSDAAAALKELVGLQAPRWNDAALIDSEWLRPDSWIMFAGSFADSLKPFLERFGEHLTRDEIELCERIIPHAVSWLQSWSGPKVLQHGDFRPDNILFESTPDGERVLTVFDWQTVRIGPPMVDVGYYLGGSLSIADRRANEEDLLRQYHDQLGAAGVSDYTWQDCWLDYRRTALYGVYGYVGTSPHVQASERGDALYLSAFRRFAAQAIDLDATESLP